MLFNSLEFIIFLLLVYCAYLVLPFRLQNYMLLGASYIFYGWWDVRFLFLVAISTTVDFWVGLLIENGQLRRNQLIGPACFLGLSAVTFLCLNPAALWANGQPSLDLASLIRWSVIDWVFAGAVGFLACMSLIYRILRMLPDPKRRLFCLMISVTTQLGLLGVFKYFNFFIESLSFALNSIGVETSSLHLNIVLPVGISFYTFQSLSYTIDIYREQFKPTNRFFDFALFVAYFPQLQAGPIERGRQLIPQLSKPRQLDFDQTARGLYLILFGFFKKVAIADGVAPVVDQIFGSSGRVTWIDVIAGTVLFAVQIYCDFSGYTDIARGISKLLGIDLIINFKQPYFARNPQEFWHRWHISLSTWLRDYLYITLGGNRGNLAFVCRNIMITMLLGGLWHGAAWNYVLWGFYQGALLCIYQVWRHNQQARKDPPVGSWMLQLTAILSFFAFVCYGWLLFRARSFTQIVNFTRLLITDFGNLDYGASVPKLSAILGLGLLIPMEIIQYWKDDAHYYQRFPVPLRGFFIAALIVVIMIGMSNEPAQFIYFQF
jgi:alginate O-acetyltransferase complex protein AlgI